MTETDLDRLRRRERELETANLALRVMVAAGGDADQSTEAAAYEVLAAIVEKARSAMVVTDPSRPDNPIIFANRAFQNLSGYAAHELVGRNCRFMQGPDTDPAAIAYLAEAVRMRREVTVDLLNYRKDGSRFLNELFVSPVFAPDGALRYFFGCQTDATDQRAISERLEGHEGRWRSRFDQLQEGFLLGEIIAGAAGAPVGFRFLELNLASERLLRLSRQTAVGQTSLALMPDLEPAWLDDFAAVVRTGLSRIVTRDIAGLRCAFEARIFQPEPGQFAVLLQDVTDRLRETQRRDMLVRLGDILREDIHPDALAYRAAALLGETLGVSRAGYGTIDPVTETILVSPDWNAPGTASIAGMLRFRDYGSYIDDLKRGVTVAIADSRDDPRTAAGSALLEAISARAFVNMPVTEEGGFVALLFLNHAGPRPWTEGDLALIREVAERTRAAVERRRAEQALRTLTATLESQVEARTQALMAAQEQLRQSQKMEAVGQLTGGLAHDFNNLLTGISGSLELIGTRIAQGRLHDIERFTVAAQGAAQRAASLTHRLLAFSRQQTLEPSPTNLNELIAGMEELIRRSVGPLVTIEVVGAGGLWPALVDPNQLDNALLNLCINARDAMPEGGRITIETANTWLDSGGGRERDLPPGQYVVLSVSDTGTGMTPEVAARAFDPFFTTKPIGQGTGLGLSMIYGFVRQSGGHVRIYSEPGQGTTMRLYLPRHDGPVGGPIQTEHVSPFPGAVQGETVLVVDDEPTVRMLVTETLETLGYAAIEAVDGASGLRVLQSAARIDLLITDVGLPGGMNGRQVAEAARRLRPELKVLFITGYAENAVLGHGHLDPGMHILTKPFAIERLSSRIRELIGGRPGAPPLDPA